MVDNHLPGTTASAAPRGRALLDVGAAMWAALAAALVFAALCAWPLAIFSDGNSWDVVRLFASVLLGPDILAPPATFDSAALLAGGGLMLLCGFGLALLLALTIHRFGLLVGIIGGAVYGLVVYTVFVYAASQVWPGFAALVGAPFLLVCIAFGAFAGGAYEWLEVEEFELAQEAL